MFRAWFNLIMLTIESQQVVTLRMAKLSLGGFAARHESRLMLFEKGIANRSAGRRLAGGATVASVLGDYRRTVRANLVRLSAR